MATYTVTFKTLIGNYAVLQTLTDNQTAVGQSFTVASVAVPFNGTQTVYALPQYEFVGIDSEGDLLFDTNVPIPNQILFAVTGTTDVDRTASTGTIVSTPTCSWVTAANIEDWLGIGTASALDTAFLTQCASACNAFAYRRRQESGYVDSLTTSPSGDVTLGTIMLGGAYYRNRGSIDQFASFGDGGAVSVTGLSGMIKQLLGIDRPQVA
jgi:hypothetical protein